MDFQEHIPVGRKTTMRIGGEARFYGEIVHKEDCKQAFAFAAEKSLPLIVLGGGSNMIFADGIVNAVVVRVKAAETIIAGPTVTLQSGKNLAMLLNELAQEGLDLSALTGIPGSIGGAIIGNAGQGPKGIWIDSFVQEVTVYTNDGWQTLTKEECAFGYRESVFKQKGEPVLIWEVVLEVPQNEPAEIQAEIQRLLQKRIETQPHVKTAGSCFKAIGDVPAWKLIDAAGLRGTKMGNVVVSEKHANFLLNDGDAKFDDAVALVQKIKATVAKPLEVEMRFVQPDGANL